MKNPFFWVSFSVLSVGGIGLWLGYYPMAIDIVQLGMLYIAWRILAQK